ncbi:hypothetical protein EDB81DRAFT_874532 [Dactylonectria macrodidyma]|uniref:Cupin type-2 domain-containing protein n=1 Tax=Dactylonectria macrodidyma TaxID=307937 RepID=A0A9P9FS66_9HYPO|nr:hypothetical protein EDB81DRAFT_874532 [Dactylonectria macrodidyma]
MAHQNITPSEDSSLPRLVRTAHTEDGTSIFASDARLTPFMPFGPQAGAFTIFDIRQSVPVNNMDPIPAFSNTLPRCPPQGAICCLTRIQPGAGSPMHRTESIDYCVVISGEIVLVLDGGDEKTIRAGEFIVQQGVNHKWLNRTDMPCQILFVMLAADKIVLEDGTGLDETVFKTEKPGGPLN